MSDQSLGGQLAIATCAFASRMAAGGDGCLAQVWLPCPEADGSISLSTQGQPFSVSGTGDLLALFRCVSCRYRFAIAAAESGCGLSVGAIGRVFASGEPEMSHDVQQYDRSLYIRVGEAKRCRIHASIFMPLFNNPEREGQPVAVFEVAQAERDVLFPALIDSLVSCLQGTGLHTADARMHAMAVGWQGLSGAARLPAAPAPRQATAAMLPQPTQAAAGPRDAAPQPQQASPHAAQSEACPLGQAKHGDAASAEDAPGDQQQAASGNRSDNNSSESIQTTRKRARLGCQADVRSLVRGHSMPEADTLRTGSVRSQRSCRFTTASLLSAGSSELTGATEQGDERVSMGAGKRLTLQQLQAQFGCGLKEAAGNLGICPTTLKRACRRHGIARWPRRPALRPVKHSRSPSTGGDMGPAQLADLTVRGGIPLAHSASAQFDLSSLNFTADPTLPVSSIMRPASTGIGYSDSQPVMVLPELAGWPPMSIPVASDLPMLAHRRIDSMDGIAHLLPGAAQDVGSATHDGFLACAALGPLPACCSTWPPNCEHSTFDSLSPAVSLTPFASAAGRTSAGMLRQLCDPPSSVGLTAKPSALGNAGLTFAPASQPLPFVDQDFSAGLSGMQPLLHADGLASDNSPIVNFPELH